MSAQRAPVSDRRPSNAPATGPGDGTRPLADPADEWGDDTIIRIAHRRGFTMVANEPIDDERLSWAALGIFVWLLSKPDDWSISGRAIARLARGLGRDRVFAALSELRDAGYLRTVTHQDRDGHWRTVNVLHECPQCDDEDEPPGRTGSWQPGLGATRTYAPSPGSPDSGAPGSGGSGLLPRKDTKEGHQGSSSSSERDPTGADDPAAAAAAADLDDGRRERIVEAIVARRLDAERRAGTLRNGGGFARHVREDLRSRWELLPSELLTRPDDEIVEWLTTGIVPSTARVARPIAAVDNDAPDEPGLAPHEYLARLTERAATDPEAAQELAALRRHIGTGRLFPSGDEE